MDTHKDASWKFVIGIILVILAGMWLITKVGGAMDRTSGDGTEPMMMVEE